MSLVRPRFRDGASILADYIWEIGHHEEDEDGLTHNLARSAPTTGASFVRQQGDPSPKVFRFKGSILTKDQFDKMTAYYEACANRTIFFRDYLDVEYEVLINIFSTQRVPVARNPRDPSIMHKWTYRIEMEVL